MKRKRKPPAIDFLESKTEDPRKLDMNSFAEIMNEFLTDSDCALLIRSKPGTQEVTCQNNLGIGPVEVLFFLMKAMAQTAKKLMDIGGDFDPETTANVVADLVKDEILEELNPEDV